MFIRSKEMSEFKTKPPDCSLCKKITYVSLVYSCTWLCQVCKERVKSELTISP